MLGRLMLRPATRLWLAVSALIPVPVLGQSIVQGRVFDAVTNQPIASSVVRLIDGNEEGRVAVAADSTGRYRITVPEPGSYRLQADRLGYEAFESATFEIETTTEVRAIDVGMRPSPVPIRGVEVSTDRVNRRLREFLGVSPAQLRIRPIRSDAILDHARRGSTLSELIRYQQIPNLQVLPGRDGPCYQFRARGCMPAYLDGARLSRTPNSSLPLEMLSTVVVVLPSEVVAYPSGAVHLFTIGFMR